MKNLWYFLTVLLLTGCTVQHIDPQHEAPPVEHIRVWIDTDMACGRAFTSSDPDDCLAYLLAERAGVEIVGVSTVAGNVADVSAWDVAQRMVRQDTPLYRGDSDCTSVTIASMAHAVLQEDTVILALGPLTNIARLLSCHPTIHDHIKAIVFVGGRSAGERFIPNPEWPITIELADLNVEEDSDATKQVIASEIPIVYVPYKAGSMIPISYGSLSAAGVNLPRELDDRLRDWSTTFSIFMGTDGFLPFDAVAVAYTLWPQEFDCTSVRPHLVDDRLYLLPSYNKSSGIRCLPKVPNRLRGHMLSTLTGS